MSAVRVRMKSAKNLDEDKNHNYLLRPSKLAANASKSPSMALLKRSKPVEKVPEARKKKIKVDEKKVNDPTEVCDQQFDKSSEEKTPTAVNLKNLKNILTDAYCDISARLKLPHPPKCVFNLQNCFTQHFHKDDINQVDDGPNLKNFLNNENPMMFLHLVNMMTMRNQFTDADTLQLLVELILSVNKNYDDNGTYSADGVIEGALMAFLNILNAFPPCWAATKKTYRQLLLEPILRNGHLANDGFDKEQSLLMNIVASMEHLLLPKSADPIISSPSQNIEDLFDYHLWESKNTQRYKFQRLKRNEKIDRLFLVMSLLIQTLEYDLVSWMTIYARCPNGKMVHSKELPLIGSVLWPNEQHRQINYVSRRIIKLFIDYVSIDFSMDKIAILSRLINLMYTTLDLCDDKMSANEIVYPNATGHVYNYGEYFCHTVYEELRANRAYGVKLCTKLIECVELPCLKLYLITKFIGDLNQHEIPLNPYSIYKKLTKLARADIDDTDTDDDDVLDDTKATEDYPFMKIVRQKYSSTISNRKLAKLLMVALRAYADIHQIIEYKQRCSSEPKFSNDLKRHQMEMRPKHKLTVATERDWRKRAPTLIAKQLANAKNERIHDPRMLYRSYTLNAYVYIFVDAEMLKRYREDEKYYEIITLDEYGVLRRLLRS